LKTIKKQPEEKALERLIKKGGKNCYLDLPAFLKELGQSVSLDLLDLLAVIDSRITPVYNIQGIVLFGSTTNARIEYEERTTWFNRKKRVTKLHTASINDIDIFVLLHPNIEPNIEHTSASALTHKTCYLYGGSWISRQTRCGVLDIFAMTAAEFTKRLEAGDSEARHILDRGILLLGSFPFSLKNNGKVSWRNKYRPQLLPRKEKVMRIGIR